VKDVAYDQPSGYAPFDQQVTHVVLGWQFEPYVVNGRAEPACAYFFVSAATDLSAR
jgi:outer membrane biosynthesis protein TonB